MQRAASGSTTPAPTTAPNGIDQAEWETRIDLAACYRLVAHYGMTDVIYTHISARVPGTEDQFLINPYGQLFSEISASSLVKIDLDGNVLDETEYEVNQAGFCIHSAIHAARHDVECVVHTHTTAGMAVSAQADGLLPLTQHAMRFYGNIGYHDYEGIALDLDERERLVADLGEHRALILRNHGLLTAGRTIPEAFNLIYYLERSCQAQIAALSGGVKLTIPNQGVPEHTAQQFVRTGKPSGHREWPALLRMLDQTDPSYRS
jgi:ribulose-5-phosphate 4-epimerase/fuculose-1-phosphate aldolase